MKYPKGFLWALISAFVGDIFSVMLWRCSTGSESRKCKEMSKMAHGWLKVNHQYYNSLIFDAKLYLHYGIFLTRSKADKFLSSYIYAYFNYMPSLFREWLRWSSKYIRGGRLRSPCGNPPRSARDPTFNFLREILRSAWCVRKQRGFNIKRSSLSLFTALHPSNRIPRESCSTAHRTSPPCSERAAVVRRDYLRAC